MKDEELTPNQIADRELDQQARERLRDDILCLQPKKAVGIASRKPPSWLEHNGPIKTRNPLIIK